LSLHSVPVPVKSYRLLAMSMDEYGFRQDAIFGQSGDSHCLER